MKKYIILLGAGHGINDLLAGYMLGNLAFRGDVKMTFVSLMIYNLLAFGGQYFVSLLLSRTGKHSFFVRLAWCFHVLALFLFEVYPPTAFIFSGMGSAIYHVAGCSFSISDRESSSVGFFAAPGVLGLIAGGYLAWQGYNLIIFLVVVCFIFLMLFLKVPLKNKPSLKRKTHTPVTPDMHDWLMIALLSVVALRSAVWNIFQFIFQENYTALIAIALSAAAGKLIGGWLADKVGLRFYIYFTLLSSAPLLSFLKHDLVAMSIGIALLQSGVPATTVLLYRSTNCHKEAAVAHTFGTAILAGAFIFLLPKDWLTQNIMIPFSLVMLAVLLLAFTQKSKKLKAKKLISSPIH
ncbi:MAG: hypothetical protein N2747_07400 [Chitinophagaceae bacterium]|nr:hypothetical protein [Chitinophagaceae bacterium]